jgi:hypothetical protein
MSTIAGTLPLAPGVALARRDGGLFDSPLVLALSFVLGTGSLLLVGVVEDSLPATCTVAGLLFTFGTLILSLEGRGRHFPIGLVRQFWVTFGLRIFVMAVLHWWLLQVHSEPFWQWGAPGGDEEVFFLDAGRWASAWQDGTILKAIPLQREDDYLAWVHPLGFMRFIGMTMGGDTVFNMKLLSCFCAALVVPYVYTMARRFFPGSAHRAAVLAFWLPDFWYYGSTILRDMAVSCMALFVMYYFVAGARGRLSFWRLAVAAAVNGFVVSHLKIWLAQLLAAVALLCWAWERASRTRGAKLFVWLALVVAVVTPASIVVIAPARFNKVVNDALYLGEDIPLTSRLDIQRQTGLDEASETSLGARALAAPVYIRVPVYLGEELVQIPPWGTIAKYGYIPRGIVECVCASAWLGFLIFLPAGVLEAVRRDHLRRTAWIWGPPLVSTVCLALASVTIVRFRLMGEPFLLILCALGAGSRTYRWTVRWSAVCVAGLFVVYFASK